MVAKNTEIIWGIVIKTVKSGESDLRVTMLCKDEIRTLTATGALKKDAKLKAATQIFTVAEFTTIGHKITGAHIHNTNNTISKDIKRYYLACAICEVILQCRGAGFELTIQALDTLSSSIVSTRQIYAEYFIALLQELGYDIEPDQDINTAFAQHLDIKIPNTKMYLQPPNV